jgi:sensor histidine kinase YesM
MLTVGTISSDMQGLLGASSLAKGAPMSDDRREAPRARSILMRWWPRSVAINFAVAASVGSVMALAGAKGLTTVLIALAFANLIGAGAVFLLPPLMRRLEERGGWRLWFVLPMALLGMAAVVALVIGLVLIALGVYPPGELWRVVWPMLGIAAVTTLGIGVGIALHESTRINRNQAKVARQQAEVARQDAKQAHREAERLATEARLASLDAHVHPHFLYNTLSVIRAAISGDGERARGLVSDLGALLRFSLERRGRRTIPLSDELRVVKAYLAIQQSRLLRLTWTIDVPAALDRCQVPPFALQPLVENSVIHVAQERRVPTALFIRARADGDTLELLVGDDGPGFGLDAIVPGHGLEVLRGRLAALYGDRAAFALNRGEGGFMVSIRIPIDHEEQS